MQKFVNRGHMNLQKGFTLIELLVVIAIIGILAGIVLASLGSARSKGGDAAVQGDLVAIRAQAELYSSNNSNSYGTQATTTSCTSGTGMFSDPTIRSAIAGAISAGGGAAACAAGTNYWVVAAQLKSDSTNAWCVSSSGSSTQITYGAGLSGVNSCL
jgi:prepilin-type N-terminal cleavage/methylation domain-containing protein